MRTTNRDMPIGRYRTIMADRERTDSGQFVETVTLENVLDVFNQVRGPVVTSSDVADSLECTTEAARQKLIRLYDQDKVDKRKTGRTVVYWRTDSQSHSTPVERSVPVDDVSPEPTPEPRENEPAAQETDEITEQQVKDALEGIDVTGRGAETKEVRRKAILHAWRELREKGEATTQELANSAFDEYADHRKFGYGESSNHYRGYTFWDSCARDVFKQLPGVESPPQRGNTWYFSGE